MVFGIFSKGTSTSKSQLGILSRILSGKSSYPCVKRSVLGSRLGGGEILQILRYLRNGSLVGEITTSRESGRKVVS